MEFEVAAFLSPALLLDDFHDFKLVGGSCFRAENYSGEVGKFVLQFSRRLVLEITEA
jgi:hypothetical protein